MEKIKPCPFCGGKAKLEKMGFPHHVYCTVCGSRVTGEGFDKKGEQSAIEKWNRRVSDADKYRWHDLRKNPDDLPTHMNQVQICWEGGSHEWYDSMFFDHERNVFSIHSKKYKDIHPIIGSKDYQIFGKAIAWREIEPFEE